MSIVRVNRKRFEGLSKGIDSIDLFPFSGEKSENAKICPRGEGEGRGGGGRDN